MKTIARFITRLQGEGDGLFIGSLFHSGKDFLKPNTVYEIVDVLGQLTIKEVGQGTGAGHDNCVSRNLGHKDVQFSWASDIRHVLDIGKSFLLTVDEYRELNKQNED
jgi:hypothetical protein